MNIINYIKYLKSHLFVLLAVMLAIASVSLSMPTKAEASINTVRDCDSNAVVYCGASSVKELQNKYKSQAGVPQIYDYFGISAQDVNGMTNSAKVGSVTKSGDVYLGSKVVAHNAVTAGRLYIPGSNKVTHNGVTFYTREPRVSFLNNSLSAYVVMKNGQFDFAILSSCGNPVKAKAIPAPKPTPTPTPKPCPIYRCDMLSVKYTNGRSIDATVKVTAKNGAQFKNITYTFGDGTKLVTNKTNVSHTYAKDGTYTIKATPSFMVDGKIVTANSQECIKVVKFEKEEPVPTPTPIPTLTPELPKELPNTGAGGLVGLFLGASSAGSLAFHFIRRRF